MAENTINVTTITNSLSDGSTVSNAESADHDATNEEEDVLDLIWIQGDIEEANTNPEAKSNNGSFLLKKIS